MKNFFSFLGSLLGLAVFIFLVASVFHGRGYILPEIIDNYRILFIQALDYFLDSWLFPVAFSFLWFFASYKLGKKADGKHWRSTIRKDLAYPGRISIRSEVVVSEKYHMEIL